MKLAIIIVELDTRKGIISDVLADSESIVVNFDGVGEKTLASQIAHLSIIE